VAERARTVPYVRRNGELDTFGPWIDRVRTVTELPRLYRDSGIDPQAHRLVLKVPRSIDLTAATPGMHLYDHLVAVDDSTLTVLSRHGDGYDTTTVPQERIVAIEDGVSLLDGRLTVHTDHGVPVSISYNAVADAAVQNLVRLLRRLWLPPGSTPADDPGTTVVDDAPAIDDVADRGLVAACRDALARQPRAHLVGTAARRVVTPTSGWLRSVVDRVWPVTLHACLAVADDQEIQVFHRRQWFTRDLGSGYSTATTILPRTRIGTITARPHDRYEDVLVATVQAGRTRLHFPVDAGSDLAAKLVPFRA
jgi:hypothetical protein